MAKKKIQPFVKKLNQTHAMINLGGKCCILNEVRNPETSLPDINFSSVADFNTFFCHKKVSQPNPENPKKPKIVRLGPAWLENENRREYRGLIFSPGENVKGYYNLWRGFTMKPKKGQEEMETLTGTHSSYYLPR